MRLIWSPEARRDLDEAWSFLAERSCPNADKVYARVEERAAQLIHFPLIGRPVLGPAIRDLFVPDVQYVIAYRIEADAIRVLRVWSTRQDRSDS